MGTILLTSYPLSRPYGVPRRVLEVGSRPSSLRPGCCKLCDLRAPDVGKITTRRALLLYRGCLGFAFALASPGCSCWQMQLP